MRARKAAPSSAVRCLLTVLITAVTALAIANPASAWHEPKRKRKSKPPPHQATMVDIELGYPAGTIVIINKERALYYVTSQTTAKRYKVAVGERDEIWVGRTFVSMKLEDPPWYPVDGSEPVDGGNPANPLGKRALYLDWSLLRIHGTPSRGSIGQAVSNGCIRMLNEDVIDLYERVHLGAPVVAVNSRDDLSAYQSASFTGKQPSWQGQAQLWAERARDEAEERQRRR